ncbi:50S ribosomal protein L25/general stress protein Ctc [Meridianimarinicoccus aquatilis]|uniref:Large ribosomal subunit protein bL25 n=1 Tax=Meridianimarinicoccus aquatilis TaxID=2552766 RepID=A0A4R6B5D2_9RHOB|nr:50S ribosomal protein L25/general stress protein Ctc [Fluviibacterium aquatile]QIE40535.1 50S ribosomal protein L25/general stress protein Ctc [Rhodobacteraceae bacterium SC52]TDL91036.1 50S ribosomal protein L25/general stress protein Ctc [Fluviibacterium aquatile]
MAGEIPDLHAEVRTGTGKGAARQTRRENYVPGIVYGGDADPLPIKIPYNALLKRLKAGRFLATLFNLKVEGHDDVRIICRAVERDVVKDLPTHVDFMRLRRTTKINLFLPVEVVGADTCPGLKKGGTFNLVRPEVELVVTAGEIPEHIILDISEAAIGDTLTISNVALPKGAKPTIDRDFVVATIATPSALASAGADDEEDTAEAEAEA